MLEIVDKLIALMGPIATLSKDKRDLRDNALRSISHALTETHLYYAGLGRGAERSSDAEEQLARIWAAAAIPLRHMDERFALMCEDKARYWIRPDQMTVEELDALSIRLSDLDAAYRQLLAPKKARSVSSDNGRAR